MDRTRALLGLVYPANHCACDRIHLVASVAAVLTNCAVPHRQIDQTSLSYIGIGIDIGKYPHLGDHVIALLRLAVISANICVPSH